jgi:hypothetical protein
MKDKQLQLYQEGLISKLVEERKEILSLVSIQFV